MCTGSPYLCSWALNLLASVLVHQVLDFLSDLRLLNLSGSGHVAVVKTYQLRA